MKIGFVSLSLHSTYFSSFILIYLSAFELYFSLFIFFDLFYFHNFASAMFSHSLLRTFRYLGNSTREATFMLVQTSL